MKVRRPNRKVVAVAAVFALGATAVGIAVAAVTSSTTLADTPSARLLVVRSEADGLDSGWHQHPGPAIVQVQEGHFMIYQRSCAPTIVGPGETYIEVPYLPVRGVATGVVRWTTTFIIPNGVPPATPVASPCD